MAKKLAVIWLLVWMCGGVVVSVAQSGELANPMRPQQRTAAAKVKKSGAVRHEESLQLTAVLISAQRSVAVINGKSLQPGERIGAYRLVTIQPDRVELQGRSGKRILRRTGTGLKKYSPQRVVKKGS